VLRGWTAQLRGLGEEVGPAVAQLWTLYLRQLRMGFEEGGHFAAAPCNMLYRERWNEMGGPPRQMEAMKLHLAARKRKMPERRKEEREEAATTGLELRKMRRKKQRQFFASQTSDADATTATDSEAPSESGFSEEGYLTDASDLSMMEERMPREVKGAPGHGVRDPKLCPYPTTDFTPDKLVVSNVAAVLALAVVGGGSSSLTLADLARCELLSSPEAIATLFTSCISSPT